MVFKLLGVARSMANGVIKQKIHYQGEDRDQAIEISSDDKRLTAGEVCEIIAGKEDVRVNDIVMRKSLKLNLDRKAKKEKKGDK